MCAAVIASNDRRQASRIRAAIEVADPRRGIAAITRDISPDGVFVRAALCELGTRLSMVVRFPDCGVPLQIAAEVVRVDSTGIGLKLIHIGEPQRLYFSGQLMRLSYAKTEPA